RLLIPAPSPVPKPLSPVILSDQSAGEEEETTNTPSNLNLTLGDFRAPEGFPLTVPFESTQWDDLLTQTHLNNPFPVQGEGNGTETSYDETFGWLGQSPTIDLP